MAEMETMRVSEPAAITVRGDASRVARELREVSEVMANTVQPSGTKAVPAKAGYRTSEFWLTVLTTLGVVAASSSDNLPPRYAAIAGAISVSAYAFSRALAKL